MNAPDTLYNPGPWELSEEGECFANVDAKDHGALARVVVKMDDDLSPSPRLLANAYLIKAAPLMYEALAEAEHMLMRDPIDPAKLAVIEKCQLALAGATAP